MPKSWTLRFSDGDFAIVFSPPLLHKGEETAFRSRLIRAYHLELLKQLQGEVSWAEEETELRSIDARFYGQFRRYYCKLAERLTPAIDPDRLRWRDRHEFFICTPPIPHPENGQLVPGLSGLEQIMGYAYVKQSDNPAPQSTTGDAELDVLTDALLVFKRRGLELAHILSLEDLARVCRQAGDRLKSQGEGGEAEQAEEPEPPEDDRFLKVKDAIERELRAIGVVLPEDF